MKKDPRRRLRIPLLSSALLVCSVTAWAEDPPTADEIVRQALARASQLEKDRPELDFTFRILSVSEKLKEDGSVAETESWVRVSEPVEDGSYERLIEKNGKPLTPEEKLKQEKQFEEFLQKRGRAPEKQSEDRVVFDEDLVSRYNFSLLKPQTVNGRPAYLLAYAPKSGDLPVRRRMDRALNKSEGTLWVDQETFELARIEFELKEKVNIWWGIIGSISRLSGEVVREPVEADVWAPTQVKVHINGRFFFSSVRQRQRITYSDFKRVESEGRSQKPTGVQD